VWHRSLPHHLDCAAIGAQATGVWPQEFGLPTNEQRRQAAKRKLDRQLARRAQRAKARRRYAVLGSLAAILLVAGVVSLIVMLSNRDHSPATAGKTPAPPSNSPSSDSPSSDSPSSDSSAGALLPDRKVAPVPLRPVPLPASVDCQYPPTAQPAARPVKPPLAGPTSTRGTVAVTLQTSAGTIGLTLDRALAPCTVNSFLSLAQQGFYTNTPCHRLVTNPGLQVLQCGDPTGSGSGGPGYTIPDEVFPELTYGRGLVAMANTGQPNSGGSQFFLIYGQAQLPPQYTVFATISPDGLKVLDQIAKAGDDGSLEPSPGGGKPNQPVTITAVQAAAT
jgi:peptidyl-prolyl cis-trans isomerase B (cyclophilin B)